MSDGNSEGKTYLCPTLFVKDKTIEKQMDRIGGLQKIINRKNDDLKVEKKRLSPVQAERNKLRTAVEGFDKWLSNHGDNTPVTRIKSMWKQLTKGITNA